MPSYTHIDGGKSKRFNFTSLAPQTLVMFLHFIILMLIIPSTSPTSQNQSANNIACSWTKISIIRNRSGGSGGDGRKTILSMPAGYVRSGRLLAVLGPSGSGKSSFLSVISRRFYNSSLLSCTNDVRHEEDKLTGRNFDDKDIAFVHQVMLSLRRNKTKNTKAKISKTIV
jgi:ABC-type transport system involved in cytochrome bd biosynthesis fused ATPase/permease subunit